MFKLNQYVSHPCLWQQPFFDLFCQTSILAFEDVRILNFPWLNSAFVFPAFSTKNAHFMHGRDVYPDVC